MKQVLIEGWRGISQSFAMVNQYQLIELAKIDGLSLHHRDLPFDKPNWNETDNNPGFPPAMREQIRAIPAPGGEDFDCVYSIASPFRKSATPAAKVLTFMTGEFALRPDSFVGADTTTEFYCRGANRVVVPSRWSKMKLVEFGFPGDGVSIVPHGVSPAIYAPLTAPGRTNARQNLGFSPEHFVFLNLGAMTWNKGIDILLTAFAQVRRRHPQARLILKDDRKLYGIAAANVVQKLMQDAAGQLEESLRSSISIISDTLSMEQMRLLYSLADCYVSPYRAEGFNLPVIEAIASGTPVIVSSGGATDDFCSPQTARAVACDQIENAARGIPGPGYHLQPRGADLVAAMEAAIDAPLNAAAFEEGRMRLLETHCWGACARQLAALF